MTTEQGLIRIINYLIDSEEHNVIQIQVLVSILIDMYCE